MFLHYSANEPNSNLGYNLFLMRELLRSNIIISLVLQTLYGAFGEYVLQ